MNSIQYQRTSYPVCCDSKRTFSVYVLVFAITVLWFIPTRMHAQLDLDKTEGTGELLKMDLDELLNTEYSSATGKSERLFSTPMSATVLTAEEIKRSGAMSIPEALRLIPGLIVREQTPGNFDVHIRGFDAVDPNSFLYQLDNSITLVMLDNQPLNFEVNGNIHWSLIPVGINDIERIEVLRGPAPAQYTNPASGIIHIISKKPLDYKQGFSTSITTYSTGIDKSNVMSGSARYNSGAIAARISGGYEHRHRHQIDYWRFHQEKNDFLGLKYIPGGFVDKPSDTTINQMGFLYRTLLNDTTSNVLQTAYPDMSLSLSSWKTQADVQSKYGGIDVRINAGMGSTINQRVYADNLAYALSTDSTFTSYARASVGYNDLVASCSYNYTTNFDLGFKAGDMNVKVLNSNVDYSKEITEGMYIQSGASYRYSSTGGRILGTDTFDFVSKTVLPGREFVVNSMAAIYARIDYTFSDFRMIGAIRAERYKDPAKYNILPQFSCSYTPSSNIVLRTTVSRGARAPFTFTLYSLYNMEFIYPDSIDNPIGMGPKKIHVTARLQQRGNTDQELLTIDNYDIGCRWNILPNLSCDVELYNMILSNPTVHVLSSTYQDGSEFFTKAKIVNYSTYTYRTLDYTANLLGGTLTIVWKPKESILLRVWGTLQQSYLKNYQYRDQVTAQLGDTIYDRIDITSTPKIMGGFDVSIKPTTKLEIDVNGYFYGSQTLHTRYESFSVEANVLANISVGYHIYDGIQLNINARNVLGGGKRQFGMADVINTFYTVGVQAEL
ncbi:MAG: TonB-dependent receptor [Candidatus Kapabacteria bacterium]|nr:TonB-dependent receptor [Candidatus Kapabacteria bacterium]